MKIYRFVHAGKQSVGVADGDRIVRYSGGDAMTLGDVTNDSIALADAELLASVTPSKIVAVGRNYAEHAKELGNEAPSEPIIFLKPPTAVLNPNGTIIRPPQSQRVDFEGELAIVIGKTARNISRADWRSIVLGFTCANDVTARDLQKRDVQFTRGKSFDTFLPLGPCIETDLDPAALSLRTRVNGETKQNGNTRDMVFDCGTIVEFITSIMTLHPGDVILTGTPAGVGPLNAGDRVEVEIEGIGVLANGVA
ncbi:MAG TPA: fumarylacetoacetate hydrolase family protein [Thermoanaerobaculia bacterium]|nr:fumarylacetoacetate hydrolase family protein [Thermoanaerobaculia bacterium]